MFDQNGDLHKIKNRLNNNIITKIKYAFIFYNNNY